MLYSFLVYCFNKATDRVKNISPVSRKEEIKTMEGLNFMTSCTYAIMLNSIYFNSTGLLKYVLCTRQCPPPGHRTLINLCSLSLTLQV